MNNKKNISISSNVVLAIIKHGQFYMLESLRDFHFNYNVIDYVIKIENIKFLQWARGTGIEK